MVNKNFFVNKKKSAIEIIIEPSAESFVLEPNQKVVIEIDYDDNSVPMTFEWWDDSIVIYEEAGIGLKLYIDEALIYKTDYSV